MTRVIAVVFALLPFGKSRNTAELAQRIKFIRPAGEQFMGITLMPDVVNDFILRKIKHIMKRDGKFHHTEVGRKMPAVFHNGFNYFISQLVAQRRKLCVGHAFHIRNVIAIHFNFLPEPCLYEADETVQKRRVPLNSVYYLDAVVAYNVDAQLTIVKSVNFYARELTLFFVLPETFAQFFKIARDVENVVGELEESSLSSE